MNQNIRNLLISCGVAFSVILLVLVFMKVSMPSKVEKHKEVVEIIKKDLWDNEKFYRKEFSQYGVSYDLLLMVAEGSEIVYSKSIFEDYAAQIPVNEYNFPVGWVIQINVNHPEWRQVFSSYKRGKYNDKCFEKFENFSKSYDIMIHEMIHLVTWTGHNSNMTIDLANTLGKNMAKSYEDLMRKKCNEKHSQ